LLINGESSHRICTCICSIYGVCTPWSRDERNKSHSVISWLLFMILQIGESNCNLKRSCYELVKKSLLIRGSAKIQCRCSSSSSIFYRTQKHPNSRAPSFQKNALIFVLVRLTCLATLYAYRSLVLTYEARFDTHSDVPLLSFTLLPPQIPMPLLKTFKTEEDRMGTRHS
jgi:hypothetical protein